MDAEIIESLRTDVKSMVKQGCSCEEAVELALSLRDNVGDHNTKQWEIGKGICLLQATVVHGSFEKLRQKYFSITERSAQRYAATYRVFGSRRENVQHLYIADLQKLAEKANLEPLRDKLLSEIDKGEAPDKEEYHRLIKETATDEEAVRNEEKSNRKLNLSRKKGSNHTSSLRVRNNFDFEDIEVIIETLIPQDTEDQEKLANFLGSERGKQDFLSYIIRRLQDLIKNTRVEIDADTTCHVVSMP